MQWLQSVQSENTILALSLFCHCSGVMPVSKMPAGPARSLQAPGVCRRSGHPSWLHSWCQGRPASSHDPVSQTPGWCKGAGMATVPAWANPQTVTVTRGQWHLGALVTWLHSPALAGGDASLHPCRMIQFGTRLSHMGHYDLIKLRMLEKP